MQNVEEINKNIENKTVDKQAWQSLGFDELQTIEIIRGIENGVDVSVYCKEEFNAAQMKALRLGLEEKLDVSRFADAQILASISIETISKLILNKVFAGNANLKPISGNCWKNNCCIRKSNECILSIIDVEKIQKEEKIKSSNSLYKLQVLMANTIYLSVLKEIDRIIGENISDSLAGKLSDLYKTNVYNAEKNKLS